VVAHVLAARLRRDELISDVHVADAPLFGGNYIVVPDAEVVHVLRLDPGAALAILWPKIFEVFGFPEIIATL